MISYMDLAAIARDNGSPYFLFDQEAFVRNLRDIRIAFSERYPRFLLGYSYKTNYIPYLCQTARRLGACAEVVSRLELDLALKLGCPPREIIFNGPIKQAEDVESALKQGMILNLDTFRELEAAVDLARRHPADEFRAGLRLNIPLIDRQGKSHHQDGLPSGRFGFTQADLEEVRILLGRTPNLKIHSLHGHSSSSTRSLWVYETIARTLAETAERCFPASIETLNVGGGFFGRPVPEMGLADVPSYQDYAAAICKELLRNRWVAENLPQLIIEPGMAVVANTMSFITQVFEVKSLGGKRFAVVDGSIFNVKPTLHRRNHPFAVVTGDDNRKTGEIFSVVGATCMEKDCLLSDIETVEIRRGDFIRIDNVGAYTVVLTPPFIHPAPPILVREAEGCRTIRRRQELEDIFGTYTF